MKCPHLECPYRHYGCEHFKKSDFMYGCSKRPKDFWKEKVTEKEAENR